MAPLSQKRSAFDLRCSACGVILCLYRRFSPLTGRPASAFRCGGQPAPVSHRRPRALADVTDIRRPAGGSHIPAAAIRLGTSEELGIPRGFVGGMRETEGGIMNPGKFTRGVRRGLLASSARVFEQTKVNDVVRDGAQVVLSTPGGEVRANRVVLATNAFMGEWTITPKHLSVPLWVIEVETEPIDPGRLKALGWTSRSGLVTQHNIMENYRLTKRNTIVFGVRRIERGKTFPLPAAEKSPDPGLVQELANAFTTRFPSLADVAVSRAWGGWIAITPSWLPVAGSPRPIMMSPPGLRTIWAVDRVNNRINGSRRNARKGFTADSRDGGHDRGPK